MVKTHSSIRKKEEFLKVKLTKRMSQRQALTMNSIILNGPVNSVWIISAHVCFGTSPKEFSVISVTHGASINPPIARWNHYGTSTLYFPELTFNGFYSIPSETNGNIVRFQVYPHLSAVTVSDISFKAVRIA